MMHLMDPHLMEHPAEDVKSMVSWLREHGYPVGPKRVRRLRRIMGHHTIYPKRNLSKLGYATYIRYDNQRNHQTFKHKPMDRYRKSLDLGLAS